MILPDDTSVHRKKTAKTKTILAEVFFHKTKTRKSGGRSVEPFNRMDWDRVSLSGEAAGEIQQKNSWRRSL
jgi:hypothetical protein